MTLLVYVRDRASSICLLYMRYMIQQLTHHPSPIDTQIDINIIGTSIEHETSSIQCQQISNKFAYRFHMYSKYPAKRYHSNKKSRYYKDQTFLQQTAKCTLTHNQTDPLFRPHFVISDDNLICLLIEDKYVKEYSACQKYGGFKSVIWQISNQLFLM